MAGEDKINEKLSKNSAYFKNILPEIVKAQEAMKRVLGDSGISKAAEQMKLLQKTINFDEINKLKNFMVMPKPIEFHNYLPPIIPIEVRIEKDRKERDYKMIELLEQIAQNTASVQYARITIDEIDSFYKAGEVQEQEISKIVPLQLEEREIKEKFHEIIGDPFVQKDWGGERCDIYTSHIRFRNRKTPCAFILKGKSYARGKLMPSDLGKNGDQIVRLFQEPAEIYFIQTNGYIDSTVESTIQAFVTQKMKEGYKVFYCLIDGIDSARILKAYQKLN
jgi:hypothetical protein